MDKIEPRAVIFDLGSTLIEYEAVPWDELGVSCVENARQYLISKGREVADSEEFLAAFNVIKERYREVAADSLVEWTVDMVTTELFDKIGLSYDEQLVDSFFDAYYEPVAEQLYAYDDTVETLAKLKLRYPLMGLVSNTIFPARVHEEELKRFGIAEYLDFKIFSSSFRLRKPHPDIFLKAANLAGHAPKECVYIGDRYLEDVTGPKGIGMPAVLKIKPGRVYPDEMPEADRIIEKLSDLTEHFEI